ncbi:ankyrin and het domain protein [Colletotrichum truncatum]|uniref:Ankyrin and het domain protein n=1 Tax=Colletotrichum truncatum TaxID=5467 RepID=A0ACC3YQQ3_COLTU|nr:ankyrin and het domain protein [Colletotrichum truncatum]XP_036581155.1 ankyrin and het domain protein [Colletotrichum truncatum]KAF6780603.1 ankyrin and het domain protein [Colletotrichum truncatum]KAF6789423.1 ankyrin and het domain protein [Colletotrichum truncatum]
MGQVYAGAARTRVWLGESTETDYQALQSLAALSQVLNDISTSMVGVDATVQMIQRKFFTTMNIDRLEWELLSEMLNRAWFKRTWIIQEVANSKSIQVHLGQIEFPWNLLSNTVLYSTTYKLHSALTECKAFKTISTMENLRRERIDDSQAYTAMPLLDMLEELRDFKATIPSDKIYGVLGLTNRKNEFVVDYAQAPEKVFTDFAVRELKSGCLDLLAHCVDSSKPKTLELPSWVPDWTCPGWTEPLRTRGLETAAGRGVEPDLAIDENAGILRIKGRMLDRIASVESKRQIPPPNQQGLRGSQDDEKDDRSKFDPEKIEMSVYGGRILDAEPDPPYEDDDTAGTANQPAGRKRPKDARYRYEKFIEMAIENMKNWHLGVIDVAFPDKKTTAQGWENFWRTLMCNRTRDNERPGENSAAGMDIYFKITVGLNGSSGSGLDAVLQTRIRDQIDNHGMSLRDSDAYYLKEKEAFETFSGAHNKWTYNRRFYRSEGGRFGWVVDGTQPGDAVVLFHGCDSTFVVRQTADGTWRIIGDCYIHGLMDGEGLRPEFEEMYFQIV